MKTLGSIFIVALLLGMFIGYSPLLFHADNWNLANVTFGNYMRIASLGLIACAIVAIIAGLCRWAVVTVLGLVGVMCSLGVLVMTFAY